MATVEGSIIIETSADKVLAALNDVVNAHEWVPSLHKIWDIQGQRSGCTYRWQYKLGALSFEGRTYITKSSSGVFRMHTEGGIPSHWTWLMDSIEEGTKLTLTIDYDVPGLALGALADKLVIERQNKKELDQALINLKQRLEA